MKNPEIAILAVLVAVLVAGWAVIQVDIYGGTSVKVTVGDDGTDVRIDGLLPSDYHYSIYSGADVSSELYYWYDESVECRSTHQMQSDFFDSMDALLKVRNFGAGIRVDTQALVDMMERTMADGTVSETAVYFCGDVLPKAIMEDGLLDSWIRAGGTVHWTGNAMGAYVTSEAGIESWDPTAFFPEGTVADGSAELAHNHTYWSQRLVPTLSQCTNGLNVDALKEQGINTVSLGLINDDGFSSYAVSDYGSGRIYVLGMYTSAVFPAYYQMVSADVIASGIDTDTVESFSGDGKKGYWGTDVSIDYTPSAGDVLYLRLGSPFVNWATTHVF